MGGLWKVGMDNLTMHTHSTHAPLPAFFDCLNYVLNSVLLKFLVCRYSFGTWIVNISLVDYDLPAIAF